MIDRCDERERRAVDDSPPGNSNSEEVWERGVVMRGPEAAVCMVGASAVRRGCRGPSALGSPAENTAEVRRGRGGTGSAKAEGTALRGPAKAISSRAGGNGGSGSVERDTNTEKTFPTPRTATRGATETM
jgi:hypothetical protein